jgi:hypothetical protein
VRENENENENEIAKVIRAHPCNPWFSKYPVMVTLHRDVATPASRSLEVREDEALLEEPSLRLCVRQAFVLMPHAKAQRRKTRRVRENWIASNVVKCRVSAFLRGRTEVNLG